MRLEKRGVHLTEIYFDNREMAEGEKLDFRKVSKYSENLTFVKYNGKASTSRSM